MSRLSFPLEELLEAIEAGDDIAIGDVLTAIAESVNTRLQAISDGAADPMSQEEADEFQASLTTAQNAALQKRHEIVGQLQLIERKKHAVHAYRNY